MIDESNFTQSLVNSIRRLHQNSESRLKAAFFAASSIFISSNLTSVITDPLRYCFQRFLNEINTNKSKDLKLTKFSKGFEAAIKVEWISQDPLIRDQKRRQKIERLKKAHRLACCKVLAARKVIDEFERVKLAKVEKIKLRLN